MLGREGKALADSPPYHGSGVHLTFGPFRVQEGPLFTSETPTRAGPDSIWATFKVGLSQLGKPIPFRSTCWLRL